MITNEDFVLDMYERVQQLNLNSEQSKKVVDLVFWALEASKSHGQDGTALVQEAIRNNTCEPT